MTCSKKYRFWDRASAGSVGIRKPFRAGEENSPMLREGYPDRNTAWQTYTSGWVLRAGQFIHYKEEK